MNFQASLPDIMQSRRRRFALLLKCLLLQTCKRVITDAQQRHIIHHLSFIIHHYKRMRQQIVAGNWKMNKTLDEGLELTKNILEKVEKPKGLVVVAPPLTHLRDVGKMLKVRKNFHLAAQNCHHEEKGAYTGEVSADMVASVGAEFVIIGHSERRQYFKEKNDVLAQKVNLVLAKGMRPIFCCGEPLHIREVDTHVGYVA